jgi:hypothetical protein
MGGGSETTLNMATGQLRYVSEHKEGPWVEEAQRLRASFDKRGSTFTLDVANKDAESHRAFLKCIEGAKTDPGFRICRDEDRRQALWQFGGERVSYEACGGGAEITGKTYLVSTCSGKDPDGKLRWLTFGIANHDAPLGLEASIDCACERLIVDRLSFDPQLRTLSFNLDTDANTVKFAGGEFQVPTIASRSQDAKVSMPIPVFTIRFNEQWQIVEMTAVGEGAHPVEQTANP